MRWNQSRNELVSVSISFWRNKILFSRLTMCFFNALIKLFSFCRYLLFGGYWLKIYFIIDFFKWLSITSAYFSKPGFMMVHDRGACAICYIGISSSVLSNKRLLTLWLNPNSIAINFMWLERFSRLVLKVAIPFCESKMFMNKNIF